MPALVILLIFLAIVTGVAGALIKGAFWLFIIAVAFLVGSYLVHNSNNRS